MGQKTGKGWEFHFKSGKILISCMKNPCGRRSLMRPRKHCIFWRCIDCLCVCFHYHLLPFASCNFFSCLYTTFWFTYLLSFPLRIGPLLFQAGCHKMQLNLAYNLYLFILYCSFFVFDDLYFVNLVVIYTGCANKKNPRKNAVFQQR